MLWQDFFKTLLSGGTGGSWRVMAAAVVLKGLAAEVLSRRGARVRWVLPAACLAVLVSASWQINPSESLILFYHLGWLAEAALLGTVSGALIHLARIGVRRRCDRNRNHCIQGKKKRAGTGSGPALLALRRGNFP